MNKICGNIAYQCIIKFFKDTFEVQKKMSAQN